MTNVNKGRVDEIKGYKVLRRYVRLGIYKIHTPEGDKYVYITGEEVMDEAALIQRLPNRAKNTIRRDTNSNKVSLSKEFLDVHPEFNTLTNYIYSSADDGKKSFTQPFFDAYVAFYTDRPQKVNKKTKIEVVKPELTFLDIRAAKFNLELQNLRRQILDFRFDASQSLIEMNLEHPKGVESIKDTLNQLILI